MGWRTHITSGSADLAVVGRLRVVDHQKVRQRPLFVSDREGG